MLPVLNYANKPLQNPNSFEVNTSLQRCLAKAIALHGMGVQVYSGEDLADIPTNLGTDDKKSSIEQKTVFKSPDDIKHPFVIKSPTGEVKSGNDHVQILVNVFEEFLPQCSSKESVLNFWKENKVAISLIEEKDEKLFKHLKDNFSKQKSKYT